MNYRIISVQSEAATESPDEDKSATLRINDGSGGASGSSVGGGEGTLDASSSGGAGGAGVNLYILAGHEDMRLQW